MLYHTYLSYIHRGDGKGPYGWCRTTGPQRNWGFCSKICSLDPNNAFTSQTKQTLAEFKGYDMNKLILPQKSLFLQMITRICLLQRCGTQGGGRPYNSFCLRSTLPNWYIGSMNISQSLDRKTSFMLQR